MSTESRTGSDHPGVSRRRFGLELAGAGLAFAAGVGATAIFGDRGSAQTQFTPPPGFHWSNRPGFDDSDLSLTLTAHFAGDPSVRSNNPANWPNIGLIGTSLSDLTKAWRLRPGARIGVLYTDPGGHWHDGWGEPGQLFGALWSSEEDILLAAAVRLGPDPAAFSFALSAADGTADAPQQLSSVSLGQLPVAQMPVGIPVL